MERHSCYHPHVSSEAELSDTVGQKHHDASLSGLCELDDGMITDRSFEVIPTIQSRVSKPDTWRTNGERLQKVLANLGYTQPHDLRERTEHELAHLMDSITREGASRTCVVVFSAEMQRVQSKELGPLDFAGDEQVQMSDAREQEQIHGSAEVGRCPTILRRPKTRKVGTSKRESSIRRLHTMIGHKPKAVVVQIM